MKNKSLIIIAVASFLALGGYLVYRNMKHEKVIASQQQDTHNRMIEMAKKNPRSGLAQMARAVKRYYADNQSYPPDLDSLFPKYIESKAFIDDIDWSYKQRGKGFLLSKSISKNNQNLIVSIDDTLNFKTVKKMMLASQSSTEVPEQKRRSIQLRSKDGSATMLSKVNEISDKTQASMTPMAQTLTAKETAESIQRAKQDEMSQGPDEDLALAIIDGDTPARASIETMDTADEAEQIEISEESEGIEEIAQISRRKEPGLLVEAEKSRRKMIADAGDQYLVWIGRNGHLGFSNVQYPEREKIDYYYLDGKWEAAIR